MCMLITYRTQIIAQRGGGEGEGKPRYACPHRNRPIAESLSEFRAMRDGKYEAGEAALRMKQNIEDGNPQMWDLFAYRILDKDHRVHHRTGNKDVPYVRLHSLLVRQLRRHHAFVVHYGIRALTGFVRVAV